MKKIYQKPAITVVRIEHASLICESVSSVENNVNIYYRGAGNGEARVKEQSNYSVWDDDWSQ